VRWAGECLRDSNLQVHPFRNRSSSAGTRQPNATVTPVAELPFTVLGYRVDVRQAASDPWSSLCAASGTLNAAGVFTSSFHRAGPLRRANPHQNGGANQDYCFHATLRSGADARLVVKRSVRIPLQRRTTACFEWSHRLRLHRHDCRIASWRLAALWQSYQFRTPPDRPDRSGPKSGDPNPH